jgi:hypothetical protein
MPSPAAENAASRSYVHYRTLRGRHRNSHLVLGRPHAGHPDARLDRRATSTRHRRRIQPPRLASRARPYHAPAGHRRRDVDSGIRDRGLGLVDRFRIVRFIDTRELLIRRRPERRDRRAPPPRPPPLRSGHRRRGRRRRRLVQPLDRGRARRPRGLTRIALRGRDPGVLPQHRRQPEHGACKCGRSRQGDRHLRRQRRARLHTTRHLQRLWLLVRRRAGPDIRVGWADDDLREPRHQLARDPRRRRRGAVRLVPARPGQRSILRRRPR